MGPLEHIEPIYTTTPTIRADVDRRIHEYMGEFAGETIRAAGPGTLYTTEEQRIADTITFEFNTVFRFNDGDDREEPEPDYEIDDAAFDALFP